MKYEIIFLYIDMSFIINFYMCLFLKLKTPNLLYFSYISPYVLWFISKVCCLILVLYNKIISPDSFSTIYLLISYILHGLDRDIKVKFWMIWDDFMKDGFLRKNTWFLASSSTPIGRNIFLFCAYFTILNLIFCFAEQSPRLWCKSLFVLLL